MLPFLSDLHFVFTLKSLFAGDVRSSYKVKRALFGKLCNTLMIYDQWRAGPCSWQSALFFVSYI